MKVEIGKYGYGKFKGYGIDILRGSRYLVRVEIVFGNRFTVTVGDRVIEIVGMAV